MPQIVQQPTLPHAAYHHEKTDKKYQQRDLDVLEHPVNHHVAGDSNQGSHAYGRYKPGFPSQPGMDGKQHYHARQYQKRGNPDLFVCYLGLLVENFGRQGFQFLAENPFKENQYRHGRRQDRHPHSSDKSIEINTCGRTDHQIRRIADQCGHATHVGQQCRSHEVGYGADFLRPRNKNNQWSEDHYCCHVVQQQRDNSNHATKQHKEEA